jgi:hypothetical protein
MTTTRYHFTFRVDTWTPDGESIVEHIAGVEDYQVALATYRVSPEPSKGSAAVEGVAWPLVRYFAARATYLA